MSDIAFFDNVLDPKFAGFLLKDAKEKLAAGHEFSRSNMQWDPAIVKASHPVLVRHYTPELSAMILGQLAKRGVVAAGDDLLVMNYAWTRLSYIPWHNDKGHSTAITVYLNETWHPDWGGVFLYMEQPGEIRGRFPKFNTGLRNSGNLPHATTPVSLDALEPRLTLQLFPKDTTY